MIGMAFGANVEARHEPEVMMVTCNYCGGSGKCPTCGGKGEVKVNGEPWYPEDEYMGYDGDTIRCDDCWGDGYCSDCSGRGWVEEYW